MKFTLPPDVELSVELDDTTATIWLEQGTDVIQVPPKHIPTLCRVLYQAHITWQANQPVRRRSKSPLYREPPTDGEA